MNWFDRRLAAFDIETTGTDIENDRIVTAAVSIVGGGEQTVSRNWLVNPGVPIPAEATEVHKITNQMAMRDGVPTATAVEEITTLLAGALEEEVPVIAFNARFDLTILDREARRHGVEPLVDRVGGPDGLLVV
ncbi:MAG TPA: exonuclease domain-containing protein, partial [Solirubrobacterales bacterium]|nr:exonuclease domain-containing protein [Solirubrobacterales bacterium]